MRSNSRVFVVFGMLLAAIAGCSSESGQADTSMITPVKGTVTYNGKPLTKGTITFEPMGFGKEASGEIQKDGTFVLTSFKKDDGAALGKNRVAVENSDKNLPAKFRSFSGSKVEVEVTKDKSEYTIDLK